MKEIFLAVLVFFGLIAAPVHYHAGFVVFENGKKVDFSDSKYMYVKPCKVNGENEEVKTDSQIEKAHLHDNIGDVVHIEAKGAKWGDLFTNIKYDIDYSKVTAFINGQQIKDIKDISIKPYDSLVIFIGGVNQKLLTQSVTKDRIIEVEKSSGSCSD